MRKKLKSDHITYVDYAIARDNGISKTLMYQRVKTNGWSIEKARTEPVREVENKNGEWIKLAIKNGINRNTFYTRIKSGWSAEKAATTPTGRRGRPRKEK